MNFIKNVGVEDRAFRITLGIFFLILGLSTGFWLALVLALILIGTSVVGTCPVYQVVGMSTNRERLS